MTDTTQAAVPPARDDLALGRYRLADRVSDGPGTSLWRAVDGRLRRPVAVRFMTLADPGAERLREAAVQASLVADRRGVPILDIVEDESTGQLVVVSEWVVGTCFTDHVAARGGDPLPPAEAAAIALEVARFLAVAEDHGVPHGRLRPDDVLIGDTGEVRVRGLGVERALHGTEPEGDPAAADVHGAGAILYAGLTGRWPGPGEPTGLPSVPTLDRGRVPWPSRVVADVPAALDRVAARCLVGATPAKGVERFASVDQVAAALAAATAPTASAPPDERSDKRRTAVRVGSVVVAAAAAVGLFALGLALLRGLGSPPLTSPRTVAAGPVASPTQPSAPAPTGGEREIPVVAVKDFDPYGNNREENPRQAPNAIDDDPSSAWRTVRYREADLSGKPGVGLLVDLGTPRPVSVVDLRLVGNGTDVSLRATDSPTLAPEQMRSMAEVTGAGDALVLRVPTPVTTRYLLVWLTQLPSADGKLQGGISDIRVRG